VNAVDQRIIDYADRIPKGETGVRPFSELRADPPPCPLVGVFMATEEDIILFGRGGSTKGTIAAWWGLCHLRADPEAVVYVLDYEHHETEWGGRMRRLGATEAEMARIHYASPYSKEWTHPVGDLADVWPYVKEDCEELAVTLLIVDSITAASEAGEAMGGKQATDDYFRASRQIGRRTLHLAHVTGTAEKWPERPFGSVHVHNYARETWAVAITREGDDGPDTHGLSSTEVELRCKKANGRPKPKPQVLTFSYEPDYGAISVLGSERDRSHSELVHEALSKTPDAWMTAKQIAAAVKEDTAEKLTEAQVYDAIRRDSRERFESDKGVRPFKFRAPVR
jgi:hypothetical protein